ncbi:MAG: bifunctional riboflavin kinase/FAD synthetase [Magnetococcales bacterium]|nr:bifunctional riboflavin kinase/FAD synthetase [Magnetococcales bacterium]
MHIIRGRINIIPRFIGAVVTIGNFDGVHRGHQAIFSHLEQLSRQHLEAPRVVITFEPHPRQFLGTGERLVRITNLRAKMRRLQEVGVDAIFVLHFDHDLAGLPAETFVRRYLVESLGLREILVGENFRFGSGGEGNLETLRHLGERHGFGVHGQPLMRIGDTVISSSMIREAVQRGDLDTASAMLGRPFEMEGRVLPGAKRGRAIGFPTANIPVAGMLHPPEGVWMVQAWVGDRWCQGVANLGRNPTFASGWVKLETHLFDYNDDLYRRWLRVQFIKPIRPEQKFAGVKELQLQIAKDCQEARDFFSARKPSNTSGV